MPGLNIFQHWRKPVPRPGELFNISWLATHPRDANESQIRSLASATVLPNNEALCRVLGRYKMIVPTDDAHIAPHLMIDGHWEMWLTEQIAAHVRPGMKVADIGANTGYFTLLMADLVGATGRVTAFEPAPRIAGLLRRSVRANGFNDRVDIVTDPLSDTSGRQVFLAFDADAPGGATVLDQAPGNFDEVLELTTRALDDLPALHDVALVKIDVEGSEDRVWAGMGRLLRGTTLKTVFMEWCAGRYADPERFLDDLVAPGFRLHVLDPEAGLLAASPRDILARPVWQDVTLALLRD